MGGWRLGIDLGGTKIEGILLDSTGAERARLRIATPAGNVPAILSTVKDLVRALEHATGENRPLPVGVGTPGALSPVTGRLRNSNSQCLNGLPLDRMLAETLERPVRIANDANCFALSEATDGAGAGDTTVFGVILGTGTGGGVVIGGKLLAGRHGIGGEWGHNPLPWPKDDERPGQVCYCGRSGCIETFLSGPGMAEDHFRRTGERLEAPQIFAAGDAATADSVERYIDRLARSLATVINLFDPDTIVLGGGLSQQRRLYEEVPKRWGAWVFSDVVTTRLLPPVHGDSSGVRGAAWLWNAV
jgi:fructokinase